MTLAAQLDDGIDDTLVSAAVLQVGGMRLFFAGRS
jgi:hypothetical protein